MPSIKKVKNWYAQSFEVCTSIRATYSYHSMSIAQELVSFPQVILPNDIRQALMVSRPEEITLPESKPNLFNDPYSSHTSHHGHSNGGNGNGFNKLKLRVPMERRCVAVLPSFIRIRHLTRVSRYYANTNNVKWPPEVQDYNKRFTKLLEHIKSRHDPTVTTVAQGVLEWKRSQNAKHIGLDMQAWLDRFYLSRIGIRFLIGQRESFSPFLYSPRFQSYASL